LKTDGVVNYRIFGAGVILPVNTLRHDVVVNENYGFLTEDKIFIKALKQKKGYY